jgi:hypothetical protein
MRHKLLKGVCLGLLLTGIAVNGWAQATAADVAKLGNELTPVGAEKGASADGTIPAWEGGITTPPAGYKVGDRHPDPFAADKIVDTITAANAGKYADKLTVGHQAMLKAYPSFKMNIYPTRRSFAAPQRIYDATKKIAANAEIVAGGEGIKNFGEGVPFPIPTQGTEVIWNHLTRWRGDSVDRKFIDAPVTRSGDYQPIVMREELNILYSHEGANDSNTKHAWNFKQSVLSPARIAGIVLLAKEPLNRTIEKRSAWSYNPGQRRVRRAPNLAFDTPRTGSDGLSSNDQTDMFSGSLEQYDWKLVGKKELYVPYNSYKLHSGSLKYSDILTPLHMNPELLRYELHRVWVVEATLKEGIRNIYKRRTLYVDEDSWQIVAVDNYDNRDQLWRVSEAHNINYYEVPAFWPTAEAHHDLQSGRYIASYLSNESDPFKFNVNFKKKNFTPSALRRSGRR